MRVPCARCGVEHDLGDLEPSYRRPDPVHAIAMPDRPARVRESKDFCALWGRADEAHRWFVRVLVPFRVHGGAGRCSWGLWVEVSKATFDEISELWDDARQAEHGPWPATLANDAATYPPTMGLRGSVRFADPNEIPHFDPDSSQDHPFVTEWVAGVPRARVVEWQLCFAHA